MTAPCGEITQAPTTINVEAGKSFTVTYEIHNCNSVYGYYKVTIKDHTGAEVYTKEWIGLDPCQTYSDSPSFTAPSTAGDYTWNIECHSWDENALRWVFQDRASFTVHVYTPPPPPTKITAESTLQFLEEITLKHPSEITADAALKYLETVIIPSRIVAEAKLKYLEEVTVKPPVKVTVNSVLQYLESVTVKPPAKILAESKIRFKEWALLYSPTILQRNIERYELKLLELRDVKRFDIVEPKHWNLHKKLLELQDKINDMIEEGLK